MERAIAVGTVLLLLIVTEIFQTDTGFQITAKTKMRLNKFIPVALQSSLFFKRNQTGYA